MPRIPEIGDDEATADQHELFAGDRAHFGRVLGASRVYARAPEAWLAIQRLHETLARTQTLPERLVALARLRVAELHISPF